MTLMENQLELKLNLETGNEKFLVLRNLREEKSVLDFISEFNHLCDKYGEDFNWGLVPKENGFVSELVKETNISQYNEIKAIARSYSCDDVLFVFDNHIYRIYHLTYSANNRDGFPQYKEFTDAKEVFVYIENQFIEE